MIVLSLFILIFWGIPIWGVIDAAMKPDPVWTAAGQNKVVWILVMIFLGIIGTAIYFFAIRPKLGTAGTA